jgi:hypothetical protein
VQCGRTGALDSSDTSSHQMKPDDEREKESTSGFQPTVNTHTHTKKHVFVLSKRFTMASVVGVGIRVGPNQVSST